MANIRVRFINTLDINGRARLRSGSLWPFNFQSLAQERRAIRCPQGLRHICKFGENTDGKGFLTSLDGIVDPRGKRIVLFGAGGAARAIGVELALAGAYSISVVNRSVERGAELVRVINDKTQSKAELTAAMVACEQRCCLCRRLKHTKMQCHHIRPIAKGGSNDFDNCIRFVSSVTVKSWPTTPNIRLGQNTRERS